MFHVESLSIFHFGWSLFTDSSLIPLSLFTATLFYLQYPPSSLFSHILPVPYSLLYCFISNIPLQFVFSSPTPFVKVCFNFSAMCLPFLFPGFSPDFLPRGYTRLTIRSLDPHMRTDNVHLSEAGSSHFQQCSPVPFIFLQISFCL